jgi:hypothetical protein
MVHVMNGFQIVRSVGQLYQQDSPIVGDREECMHEVPVFVSILHPLGNPNSSFVKNFSELRFAFHQSANCFAELLFDVLKVEPGVLDGVLQCRASARCSF